MTHADAGHYAAKHPQGTKPDSALAAEIEQSARGRALSCAAAHTISKRLMVAPAEVGRNMDLMEVRLTKCQLGLFGYQPEKKIVTPAGEVSAQLEAAITAAVTDGRLSCADAWQIADRHGIKRLDLSAAVEALGLKIKPCQLGAF